jgi:hypothetical protein
MFSGSRHVSFLDTRYEKQSGMVFGSARTLPVFTRLNHQSDCPFKRTVARVFLRGFLSEVEGEVTVKRYSRLSITLQF